MVADEDSADSRAESRRRQVIEAAIRCFRRNGFHSTSMAALAKEAGMSVGHIYHYFENKEAIIAAFIEDDLEEFRAAIRRLHESDGSFVDAMVDQADHGFDDMCDPDYAGLFLEVTAEAGRNPRVADLVRQSDAAMRNTLAEMIAADCGCTEASNRDDLMGRVEVIAALYEGLTIRAIRNPDINRDGVLAAMRLAIARLLSP
ncbi:TetR/AcrR family transcriptional regulator [Zavarzinia aquatilis]|uniref:TetR family transcriptional regulator n=1 Tax=Zavarzinia aquatilis TaxID=2211142 RepID=A0A317DX88_9PROT|nr:TetR/AcrR family transcriptional regulator [Zavarzinia aquatilis]PWR19299.1 TetR family transcriptional regulator [Zavarzinia aquatilis]